MALAQVTIVHNPVTARIINPTREVRALVSQCLSYEVPGSAHMGIKNWDGYSSFYSMKKDTFPAGFVRLVRRDLERTGHRVIVRSAAAPEPKGPALPKVDDHGFDPRYDYQVETMERLVKLKRMIAQCATGCHAKGEKVLMFDGTYKAVEEVVVGDALMGPDSRPRHVLRLCRGTDEMYRIIPHRGGRSFVVNGEHILSLEQTTLPSCRPESVYNGQWVELTVNEYLAKNKTFKHIHKLHRSRGIDFHGEHVTFDPYILGVFLGNGSVKDSSDGSARTPAVTTADPEIVKSLQDFAETYDGIEVVCQHSSRDTAATYRLSAARGRRDNPVKNDLKALGVWGMKSDSKHVPHAFKVAPESDRLQILAGLIDTDGHLHNGGYDFVSCSMQLAEDVAFIARSLGFGAQEKEKTLTTGRYAGRTYYRVSIYGDVTRIPVRIARKVADSRRQKKDCCLSGFSVEHLGRGEYYGFHVDDDNLYLLSDFSITHNSGKSRIFKLCAERLGLPTLFITTRKSLMYQMIEGYKTIPGTKKPVGILGDGVWKPCPNGVNFAIVDTIASRLQELTVEKEIEKELFARQELIDKEIERTLKKLDLPTNLSVVRAAPPALKEKVERVRKFVSQKLALNPKELARKVKAKVEAHNRRRLETLEFLKGMGFICLEEAHEVGSDSFFGIAQACVNAHYRLALTATPFMRDDKAANMRLMAATGPVGIQVSEKLLIDRGILATPYFKFIQLDPPPKLYRSTKWQRAYAIGVVDHEARNRVAINEVIKAKRYGLTSMLLVAHTRHGAALEKALKAAGVKTRFIYGANEQKVRQEALNDLDKGVIDCLIGTTILDVGVDVPSVGVVGILGGGKAEVQSRQRIGRGLRAKKFGPNVCFVFDFTDDGNNHLTSHARQRRAIIDQTPGFAERVVEDFDYEGLGFKAV